ncbi:hypothetical protein B0J11DRAFT_251640 [Dendryphion nanum]|uniref:Uncharacterized protein n=1 Tax=Dendryphion nanum TaxID=256645 RepID=A0A9P9E4H2_9PLEO|nr:hypothetical protein B0J11DRAFT_251640 [Dendryphion nanum]
MHSTTIIPGPNKRCSKTPTVTSLLPCQTACPKGCATQTITSTASTSCLPTAPTLPPPPSSLLTSTKTPKPTKPTDPTITPPPRSRPCYTQTVSATNTCPEDSLGCPPPDCIWLSTRLVPPGKVEGCETTPTVTNTRKCWGRCHGECATQWVTETATAW